MDARPYCPPCRRRYRCKKNEVAIRYGNEDLSATRGCSVLIGDLWKCPGCGQEIVVGWAQRPFAAHEHPELTDWIYHLALAIDASLTGYVALDEVPVPRKRATP